MICLIFSKISTKNSKNSKTQGVNILERTKYIKFHAKRVRWLLSKLAVNFCYFGCVKCGFHFDSKLKNNWKKFLKGRVGCQKTFEIELREMDGR